MSEDFVTPRTERLPLEGGQFVDIQKRLNHGDTEDMFARISPYGIGVNRREVRTAKILAYLVGWSLQKDGAPVPYALDLPEETRLATIRSLDPDRAVEIHTAIEAHEGKQELVRAALKKTLTTKPADASTSVSPSAPAGPCEKSEP